MSETELQVGNNSNEMIWQLEGKVLMMSIADFSLDLLTLRACTEIFNLNLKLCMATAIYNLK